MQPIQLKKSEILESARDVLHIECDAIKQLLERIDHNFLHACETILTCKGRTVVLGMGKSGHIAKKIAATLASTGTPAFYVHPGEANHGDMGMITTQDVVLAISYSGETEEVLSLLPLIKRLHAPLIVLCGNTNSSLVKAADTFLDISVAQEACPLGLAPTASTTATLAMGDALAISLLKARGFTANDFARFHPGGSLGRQLLMQVSDLMHTNAQIPMVKPETILHDAILEMTRKSFGMTLVVDAQQKILGIFTDGDLRRMFEQAKDLQQTKIGDVMHTQCLTVAADLLAADALKIMRDHKITVLPITNEQQQVVGIIHMHDLLRAGVI